MEENRCDFARTSGNLIRFGEIMLDLVNFTRKYLYQSIGSSFSSFAGVNLPESVSRGRDSPLTTMIVRLGGSQLKFGRISLVGWSR